MLYTYPLRLMSATRMSQSSSKASLSSFGYRKQTLADAGIEIDDIHWKQLPPDLKQRVVQLRDIKYTVPAGSDLVSKTPQQAAPVLT